MKGVLPKFAFSFMVLFSTISFGQSKQDRDSVEAKLWVEDCENKVFTKVEILPTVKGGNKKFEDSLISYINALYDFQDSAHIKLRFTVSSNSNILSLERISNTFPKPEIIEQFIRSHSTFWKPAIQNGRQVCAYMYLDILITNKKIVSKITQ